MFLVSALKKLGMVGSYNYAPNFEEVEGSYLFGPVRLSVHSSVCYAGIRSQTVRNRILKVYMWNKYEN